MPGAMVWHHRRFTIRTYLKQQRGYGFAEALLMAAHPDRFGPLALVDTGHLARPPERRWSRTSPQHVDRASLARLFPDGFFAASFAVVRHPVSRLVSAYHFQREVEGAAPEGTGFSDWLADLPERLAEEPFAFDNHVRPMDEMVPEGAEIFHLEHGLDAIVPWIDAVAGGGDGPRAIPKVNEKAPGGAKAVPTEADLARIAQVYAADFARFGYRPGEKAPLAPPPAVDERVRRAAEAERRRDASPAGRLRRRLARLAR